MPPSLVHWKPSAPGQYQAKPTTTEPSPLTLQALPQLPSKTHPSAGCPRSTQPVLLCHRDTLVVAPTGSGKTLAAFLWSLDRLAAAPVPEDRKRRCRVLYVSPLKALAVDVERNLRAPLAGIGQAAARLGLPAPDITVGMRSGDTPADERRRFATRPPDILITTPESLFLLLTSAARESLRGVDTVIVDEVHAVAGTKRGAHLALSLERLDALLEQPGTADRAVGDRPPGRRGRHVPRRQPRRSSVVQPPSEKIDRAAGRRAGRGHVRARRARPARSTARQPASRGALRSGRTSRSASSTSSRPTARRSSSPTRAAWPSGCAPGSTRSTSSGAAADGTDAGLADPAVAPAQVMAQSGASRGAEAVLAPARTTARSPRSSAP